MQYSFRLAELLGHVPDPRKRPGTIKAIVEYTGLDRHQVAALLKNEVKYIPLKALSRLCDYLIEHGHATAEQLPGALFAVEPENFWELLARRKRLEMCVGVRKDVSPDSELSFVVASDSVLLGELLNGVTSLGGTAKLRQSEDKCAVVAGRDAAAGPSESSRWSGVRGKLTMLRSPAAPVTFTRLFPNPKGIRRWSASAAQKVIRSSRSCWRKPFNCNPFESQDGVAEFV